MTNSPFWLTRLIFQRALAAIYLVAFLILINQFIPLLGDKGLLPARLLMKLIHFWDSPSLFYFRASDRIFMLFACSGVVLSLLALTGLSERYGIWLSGITWLLLWISYLSFVNAGQVFYGFGWETLLLETGFLAIFLGSSNTQPSQILFWLVRWLLFRVMFGAGLIKIRGDECWRNLTCMVYHYETQPIPNPLSWNFHHLPVWFHKIEVLFTHFVELVVPFFYFIPGPIGWVAGGITIFFQGMLILSGNLSWLNYITIVLCLACFDDRFYKKFIVFSGPELGPASWIRHGVVIALALFISYLSIRPTMNLISPMQVMNTSFDPLRIVNTYGAFGSVTRKRMEVILEGSSEAEITDETVWKEYQFKGKPGDVHRRPALMSPYHWRIDWQMWFAAMSDYRYHAWILNLVAKLLQNDPKTLSLIALNPFRDSPPKFIRARLYHYRFTTPEERKQSGDWWVRTFARDYLPPLTLNDPSFRRILESQEWV